ncbi:beta-glucosidase [Nonomuraea solani]|uniref:Beta-glucosidase n=1 Tax=Nonomuraea solani TaxID=1144553 RepID=A0A1H6EXP0_9ACTN|nr:glycoside hydrolase family 3 C-terminal domain-containing protein [Nonomuraea solani]SEH02173.1 beta-glucosidase [Nonomuraea solani]
MHDSSRFAALVQRLSLAQKVGLLAGATFWTTPACAPIGLRSMALADGPAGVRGLRWDAADPSVCFPSPTALGASWDVEAARDYGRALGAEARRKGIDVVLAPTLNVIRTPFGGRAFECYSEDPVLIGAIGAAVVAGLQEFGVAATIKHYVANDSETERYTVDVGVDERTLREVYFAPFETVVREAGPWAVMAAYNAVDGTTMTEHPLLDAPLRTEWGFDGLVMSDWRATRSTVASARAGLDLAMPGPVSPWGQALVDAVERGEVDEAAIDRKAVNLLGLAERVGALSDVTFERAAPEAARVAADAAVGGTVLLTNDGTLPLAEGAVRRVLVVGEAAATPRFQGGGSAEVIPAAVVSPLDALRAALPDDCEVVHVPGTRSDLDLEPLPLDLAGAIDLTWLDPAGSVVHRERRASAKLVYLGPDVPAGAVSCRIEWKFTADEPGEWQLGFIGCGYFELRIDGTQVLAGHASAAHEGPGAELFNGPSRAVTRDVERGETLSMRLDHTFGKLGVSLTLGARRPRASVEDERARLRAEAAACDVAIVFVSTNRASESEGVDRDTLALPGDQDEVMSLVAGHAPATVAVVCSGAPVALPWREQVSAILAAWFGGQEVGPALADVITGRKEPRGRLPMSWPADDSVPVHQVAPSGGRLDYAEGLHIGYRAWLKEGREPAWPFGHGLGYTTWELSDAAVTTGDAGTTVTVTARNTGDRPGRTVVQVYLARPDSVHDRPVRWLAGFAAIDQGPGTSATHHIRLPARAFQHWSAETRSWHLEPGRFEVQVGVSATDIHQETLVIQRD